MRDEVKTELISMLERHEGFRQFPYKCTTGHLTIGIGRNLDDNGIDKNEAVMLLDNDITKIESDLLRTWPHYLHLNDARQIVVFNMVFQLGIAGFMMFVRMLRAIEAEKFEEAARQMFDSRWYEQTPARVSELAHIMETGALK